MEILFGTHPKYIEHDAGSGHPEQPARLDAVLAGVEESGVREGIGFFVPEPATMADLHRVHDPAYVDALRRFCLMGGGQLDPDTAVSVASWDAALLAAGSGLDAVRRLRAGEASSAFLAVRPPGHHAVADRAMGFCLINNVAVTAASLVAEGEKVLIFDYDAHHGNGTQDIFYRDPNVLYVSFHQYPLYPGTGRADEVGAGAGVGTTVNIPVPAETTLGTYQAAIDEIVAPAVDAFGPTWVIASAGFDGHRDDPLTELGLTAQDFGDLTSWLFALVPRGRRIAILKGGYNLRALTLSAASTLAAMVGERLMAEKPSSGEARIPVIRAIREARARSLEL